MGLGRVLVVDDSADIRKVLRLTLIKAGYDVVEAEDGAKGLVVIQKSDGYAMPVDVIICDLCMPRMNGVEAIAYFRSQFPAVPVIVLTGSPDLQKAELLKREHGVTDYLIKPIQPEQLLAAIRSAAFQKAVKGRVFFAT